MKRKGQRIGEIPEFGNGNESKSGNVSNNIKEKRTVENEMGNRAGDEMEERTGIETEMRTGTADGGGTGCECCGRTKERTEGEYKDLIHRLNRIEGQIRGIRGMVERDAYCPEILVQVAAANAALNSFNKVLLANHIRTCVARDIREGKDETIDELVATLQKLMK